MRRKSKSHIHGMAAMRYGAGAGQESPMFAKKSRGLKVHRGHGRSHKMRRIASGR